MSQAFDESLPRSFDVLIQQSMSGLQIQTGSHQRVWGLGGEEQWDLDQDEGRLIFTFPDKTVIAPAQIIGTFDEDAQEWMWAWANRSIDPALQRDALRVRQFGEERKIDRLTQASWPAQESDAWTMTALAVRLCGANGAYRGPAGSTYVFMSFGQVTITKTS